MKNETWFVSPDEKYNIQFEGEVTAFEAMREQLLRNYDGKFVAIYQGEVADVDEDDTALYGRMLDKYGDDAPFYIQQVLGGGIPTVSIPGIDGENSQSIFDIGQPENNA